MVIVPSGAPYMTTTGSFVVEGSLEESGELVLDGVDFDHFVDAIRWASDLDELRFQGVEQSSIGPSRFEFMVPIPVLQQWLSGDEGSPFLDGNIAVNELPKAALEERCGLSTPDGVASG